MTVNRVRQVAKRLGATYEDDSVNVRVEAPPFHIWNEGDVHELVCTNADDAAERMAYGLSRCPDGRDCDWCNDNRALTVVA